MSPKLNFKNLVCEGGGVKGAAFGGCLQVLEERDILQNIIRVAGTSVGAITACLLACGYQAGDVTQIINNTNFEDFKDSPCWIFTILKKFGYYKGNALEAWLGKLVETKTGSSETTFKEIHEGVGTEKGFRDLSVVATNVSQQKAMIFDFESSPMRAVRMSMSVPFYYQAVKFGPDLMVDGGLAYAYPIDIFDRMSLISKVENGQLDARFDDPDYIFNWETIGLKFGMKRKQDMQNRPTATPVGNIEDFVGGVVAYTMEMANMVHVTKRDSARSIFINTGNIQALDFNISKEQKDFLVNEGKVAAKAFLQGKEQTVEIFKVPMF
eukprot:Platyproteum_vivax@DN6084_c0_g1_i4.p1